MSSTLEEQYLDLIEQNPRTWALLEAITTKETIKYSWLMQLLYSRHTDKYNAPSVLKGIAKDYPEIVWNSGDAELTPEQAQKITFSVGFEIEDYGIIDSYIDLTHQCIELLKENED